MLQRLTCCGQVNNTCLMAEGQKPRRLRPPRQRVGG